MHIHMHIFLGVCMQRHIQKHMQVIASLNVVLITFSDLSFSNYLRITSFALMTLKSNGQVQFSGAHELSR